MTPQEALADAHNHCSTPEREVEYLAERGWALVRDPKHGYQITEPHPQQDIYHAAGICFDCDKSRPTSPSVVSPEWVDTIEGVPVDGLGNRVEPVSEPQTVAGKRLASKFWAASTLDEYGMATAFIFKDMAAVEAEAYEQGFNAGRFDASPEVQPHAHDASLDVVGLLVDGGFIAPDLEAKARAALGRDASLDVVPPESTLEAIANNALKDAERLYGPVMRSWDEAMAILTDLAAYPASPPEYPDLSLVPKSLPLRAQALLTSSQPAAPTEATE